MIIKLQNEKVEISNQIQTVFQLSYAVEAKLLKATYFPPLNRPLESYIKSDNMFFGYFENTELAGIIELELADDCVKIYSLVVNPEFFRRGIASKLLAFIFNNYDSKFFTVETAVKNKPATELYKKLGFTAIKQWDTEIGIRKILFERRIIM